MAGNSLRSLIIDFPEGVQEDNFDGSMNIPSEGSSLDVQAHERNEFQIPHRTDTGLQNSQGGQSWVEDMRHNSTPYTGLDPLACNEFARVSNNLLAESRSSEELYEPLRQTVEHSSSSAGALDTGTPFWYNNQVSGEASKSHLMKRENIPTNEPLLKRRSSSTSTFASEDLTCYAEGCSTIFTSESQRKKHEASHRPARFVCHYEGCNKRFRARAKLKRHYIVHTGEKKFICEKCNKAFGYKANLKTHMRTHTGEKPYVCTFQGCKRRFAQASNRKIHVRTHFLTPESVSPSSADAVSPKEASNSPVLPLETAPPEVPGASLPPLIPNCMETLANSEKALLGRSWLQNIKDESEPVNVKTGEEAMAARVESDPRDVNTEGYALSNWQGQRATTQDTDKQWGHR